MKRSAWIAASVAGLSAPLLLVAGAALAEAPRPGAAAASFLDGARVVTAERLGPAAPDAEGRALTRVRLRYEGAPGAAVVEALVDRTAIVQIAPGSEAEVAAAGVRLLRPLMPSIGLWLAEGDAARDVDGIDLAARLAGEVARGVAQAVPNLRLRVAAAAEPYTPNDPMLVNQWYLERIGMAEAWGRHRGDAGTSVVVVDTGCDLDHPDLVDKIDPGIDVVAGDSDPTYDPAEAGAAHGTSCASLIAASTDNGEGIAGVCPECRLRCVRLVSDVELPISVAIEAFDFALQTNAAVVSNSWGFVDPMPVPQAVADAVENVHLNGRGGKGALILFASGNDDRELIPGEIQALPSVLTVGAINQFDDQTQFTNYGAEVDLVAPVGTTAADIGGPEGYEPGDYTANFGGTSSACPVAAGVAALLASAAPERTAEELYDVMIRTARPAPLAVPDANGHDPIYGYGVVDPLAALNEVLGPEGTGGTGGAGGAPAEPSADSAGEEGGCGCRVIAADPHGRAAGPGAALVAAALLAYAARRRRR